MVPEEPEGSPSTAAHRIVREHAEGDCRHCRDRRCWMLEWALKVTILEAGKVPDDLEWPVRLAARRVAEVHWPGDDGLCSPCLLPDCEPGGIALTWLNTVHDSWMPPIPNPRIERALRGPTPSVADLRRITGLGSDGRDVYGSEAGPD
ncbi:hypothetical protein Pen02_20670 [Plantactinospora endophytica]|uniref:4Fe-4S Wbl-type domain-containing protein n=2 Tax=Plantactinospora endophytica TaxID=673535 RepID=A0ABQ4DXG8_9ACTN|nr:hypothetical protein Pen02_20670 [Plantactinospora endophytica]